MRKALLIFIIVVFLVNTVGLLPLAQAQDYRLPAPGVIVHLSPPLDPPILKGIKVHPDNPFKFEFILDKGDSQQNNDQLKEEASKLIKYFLASLTIPEKDLWVNLSPYEKDRIIPNSFGLTEMGRDLLAEDYMLKQITASLIYPEDSIGKKFWKRIYEEAYKKYGTTDIPVNTFNKVWIVPEKAVVYENAKVSTAYVVESKLKVMLEQDYLSLEKHEGIQSEQAQSKDTNQLGSQIVREIVIPQLTTEVNENKNFAKLRQVYNSLILATWYKKKIKDSILGQVYEDKNKVAGVNIEDPKEKDRIYQKYLRAFKKGVFNYIKEEVNPPTQETIPRKYFSGGFTATHLGDLAMITTVKTPVVKDPENLDTIQLNISPVGDATNGDNGVSNSNKYGWTLEQVGKLFNIPAPWGAHNNVRYLPEDLVLRILSHPEAEGRNQAERFRNALNNPLIDEAVGNSNGIIDPARGVIALRPGADRFVALHEAVEGIIRARLARRNGVDPTNSEAMNDFFKNHPEIGDQAHQRAVGIEQRARNRYMSSVFSGIKIKTQSRVEVLPGKGNNEELFISSMQNVIGKEGWEIKDVSIVRDRMIEMEGFVHAPLFAHAFMPWEWGNIYETDDDSRTRVDKGPLLDMLFGKGNYRSHPAERFLPPNLKAMIDQYQIRLEQIKDEAWIKHWQGLGDPPPNGVQIGTLLLFPETMLGPNIEGNLESFIDTAAHEIGHVLDHERFISEYLSNEGDAEIQQVLEIGTYHFFQSDNHLIDPQRIPVLREELSQAKRHSTANELLVSAIGLWLANPEKYQRSYPLAYDFLKDMFPDVILSADDESNERIFQMPSHWGASNGSVQLGARDRAMARDKSYNSLGLGSLLDPLDLTASADFVSISDTVKEFNNHPMFSAAMTSDDKAMFSEILQWVANNPYSVIAGGSGSILGLLGHLSYKGEGRDRDLFKIGRWNISIQDSTLVNLGRSQISKSKYLFPAVVTTSFAFSGLWGVTPHEFNSSALPIFLTVGEIIYLFSGALMITGLTVKKNDPAMQRPRQKDAAMRSFRDLGGIDLTPANKVLQTQNGDGVGVKFHINQAQLAQLQNAPGFTIDRSSITIEPLKDLVTFLQTV